MEEKNEQQTIPLSGREQEQKPTFNEKEPLPLSTRIRRPWRGIFLVIFMVIQSYFLLFCGLLFFTHGFHKYVEYSVWDLIAVWTLASMLIIPGVYFGVLILMIEIRVKGFTYKNYPQLVH